MLIKEAIFVISNQNIYKCPKPDLPEYAFIGRSNVGKSSLINMLTTNNNLAKTSSTPGKTKLINHFLINNSWYIVDLPGYGYARSSKKDRSNWQRMIEDYIETRENLMTTFVLVDSRIEPQKKDIAFIEWMGNMQLPFVIVFTKSDKISPNELAHNVSVYKKELLKQWDELPEMIFSSSKSMKGKEEILSYIEKTNLLFEKPMK
ncbi:MAG: YihA family ribosome biogenesis GTP-binding protein [Bacteroidetes bacterium]|nr:YihA family ribosome biogenesis GTP-binding protein [Bacteroidota bacterium]